MTGTERVRAALALEKTDRVPVVPQIIQHGLQFSGAGHGRYSTDSRVMAETILATERYYGFDAVYVSSDNYILTEAFGSEVHFPDDEPPQLIKHILEDGYRVCLKKTGPEDGRMPVILEAARLCRQALGEEIFIRVNIDSAPFSAAASVRGPEKLMIDLYDNEDDAQSLLEQCTDLILAYGKAAANAGAHGIAFGDSVAGLLSRDQYETFALPWARKAISGLKTTGLPVFYHICGKPLHILDLMVESGADCLEIDSMVSMKEMAEIARGKCALMGNISTVAAFLRGSPEQVRTEAFRILDCFGNRGGLLLSSGCEIPRNSPRENVAEMLNAALEYPYQEVS
jgi:uroporphyrinogen decarboxylase